MSRSNGPVTRGGGYHQDWQQSADADLPEQPAARSHRQHQWPGILPEQRAAHPRQASQHDYGAYPHQPQAGAYHYPQDHYDQGHYGADQYSDPGYPADTGGQPPFSRPVQHPPFFGEPAAPHEPQANAYPPRFEDYLGQAAHGHASYQQEPAGYDHQGLSQLQHPNSARRTQASLRDQLQASQWHGHDPRPQGSGRAQAAPDPREYDLGSYMPADDGHGAPYGAHGNSQQDPRWPDPNGFDVSTFDAGGHRAGAAEYYAQLGGNQLAVAEPGQEFEADADEDADDYEYEEPARGRRGLMIAAALAGAIVVGGGLAYGYKAIVGPSGKGTPPVIRADAGPVKSQPEEPGGKQFAHSDSKLMGRLEEGGSSSSGSARASTLDEADSGVRRVPTIVVGRDGSIAPPPAEPRLPPATVAVPGMTIVNGFGGRPTMMPNQEPEQSAQVPPAPRIIAKATPETSLPVVTAAAPRAEAQPEPPPPPRNPVVQVPSSPAPAAAAQAARPAPKQQAAVAPAPKSNPVGYVAVLASQKSRIDALKTFADLQQKYNSVLHNKIPDVQEADLSARGLGTMYRVVVGPPSSREAAADLCGQLKSVGFEGCWVTAY